MPANAQKPATKPRDTPTPPPHQTPTPKEDEWGSHALDAFARADATSVQAAASSYKMRSDKVENKPLVGTEERGITASGTHESAVQAAIYGKAEVVELADAYAVLVQAGLIIGGSFKLGGELEAKYGKLTAKLGANLTLFGGVVAQVSGRAQVGKDGVVLQGSASGFAGAKGKASVETTIDIGAHGLGDEVEAEGKAGAWGEAEGEIGFSKETIAARGTVQLGAAGEVGGGFSIKVCKIELHLDAKGAVGICGGGDGDMAIDLK